MFERLCITPVMSKWGSYLESKKRGAAGRASLLPCHDPACLPPIAPPVLALVPSSPGKNTHVDHIGLDTHPKYHVGTCLHDVRLKTHLTQERLDTANPKTVRRRVIQEGVEPSPRA